MQRPTVLMLFGGESSEHDVSIASARNVFAAIDNEKYKVLLGYIDKRGHWWLLDEFPIEMTTADAEQLLPAVGSGGFVTHPSNHVIRPDVILPILHGRNGEDGSVQGLSQLLHIPIVGCGVAASAIAMDKVSAKRIAKEQGVAVVPYRVHRKGDESPDYEQLSGELSATLFVKPAAAGSSVGVSKVAGAEQLVSALDIAHGHDDVVLIERAIAAREIEVGVIGDYPDIDVSVTGEIIPEGEFYSYDSKYADGTTSRTVIPADISEDINEKIRQQARRLYNTFGCGGFARIDFFIDETGQIYFNEINTIPGFTNISMFPKLWRASGLSYPELIDRLIGLRL